MTAFDKQKYKFSQDASNNEKNSSKLELIEQWNQTSLEKQ